MESLTKSEQEIAFLLCNGLSNKEIAESIGIKEKTVKYHLTKIYKKSGTSGDRAYIAKFSQTLKRKAAQNTLPTGETNEIF